MNLQIPVFIPGPMPQRGAKLSNAERYANAARFRDMLIELLRQHGPLGSRQLVELTGSNINTVREYMSKLVNEGRAGSKRIPRPITGGSTWSALYSVVGDGMPILKGEAPKQKTLTTYPLNHRRDPMAAAFFGPART